MKVEVLYVSECPSHRAAVKLVKDVLAAEGITTNVDEVLVRDEEMASDLKFLGSPTIRINGKRSREKRRLHRTSVSVAAFTPDRSRLPSRRRKWFIELCCKPGKENIREQGTGVSASLTAIVSAIATIGCCLPIGFAAALGAGAASAFVTTLRPWLLALSVVLLGFGFWQQYRAKQCAVRGRLLGNVLLWTAVVVVLGMILFPQEIAAVIADRFWK